MFLFERPPFNKHRSPTSRSRALILGASLLGAACTSTVSTPPPSGPCADRSGSYIVRLTQRSGTCGNDGDVAEGVVNIDATTQQAISDTCTGEATASEENCSVQFTLTCKRDDLGPGWTARETGKSTWNEDGSRGNGTEQITIFRGDGIQECSSLADITWVRQ